MGRGMSRDAPDGRPDVSRAAALFRLSRAGARPMMRSSSHAGGCMDRASVSEKIISSFASRRDAAL